MWYREEAGSGKIIYFATADSRESGSNVFLLEALNGRLVRKVFS